MTEQVRMEDYRIGSWERPDPAGIVRRGEAAQNVRGYVEKFGEPPVCYIGSRPGEACDRPAVMEVYGVSMCEAHGEEAAAGAMEEIAHDLDQELQRPMHPHVRSLSPHIEHALRLGFRALPGYADAGDYERSDALLLAAFPLDRDRADAETVAYVRDPDANGRGIKDPPYDAFMMDRHIVCRHMRLAFEEGAAWLVEALEVERAEVAAQAAYALALEREASLQ